MNTWNWESINLCFSVLKDKKILWLEAVKDNVSTVSSLIVFLLILGINKCEPDTGLRHYVAKCYSFG